jgi:hypothetical protein
MSQTLLIQENKTERSRMWDSVIVRGMSIKEIDYELRNNWVCENNGYFVGPWKVTIESLDLFNDVRPIITEFFNKLKIEEYRFPESIWGFYYKESFLFHPSDNELNLWLEKNNTSEAGDHITG